MEVLKIALESILNFYKRYKVEIFFGIAFILGLFLIKSYVVVISPNDILNDFKFHPDAYEVKGYYESGDNYYIDLYHISGEKMYSCPITKESYDVLVENNGVVTVQVPVS